MTKTLASLRREIDSIDQALVELLAKRFRVVDHVIAAKRQSSMPAHIQSRVNEVIKNARSNAARKGLPADSIGKLWQVLVSETIAYERGQGIAAH